MKKNATYLSLFSVLIVLGAFLWVDPKQEVIKEILRAKLTKKTTLTPEISIKTQVNRKIASVPTLSPIPKRSILGSVKNLSDIHIVNMVSKDWKKKYINNFMRMSGAKEIKNFEVIQKKSILKVKNNIGKNLEHILVSFNKPNGQEFSFEALIDSQTGQLVRSWNKTHYEKEHPFLLNPAGKEFYQE